MYNRIILLATTIISISITAYPQNPMLVKDIVPDGDSYPELLGSVNGILYFGAYIGSNYTMWSSDGSVSGTVQISDQHQIYGGNPRGIAYNNKFYVSASYMSDYELCEIDGDSISIVNSNPTGSDNAYEFVVSNNQLFFQGDGNSGTVLMKYDGSNPTVAYNSTSTPILMEDVNDYLYFALSSLSGGIWYFQDTTTINQSHTYQIEASGSGLGFYFATMDTTEFSFNNEPWVFNPDTLYKLIDINPDGGSETYEYAEMGSYVYFPATDGDTLALWRTDGTTANTMEVIQLPDLPEQLTVVGNRLFFLIEEKLWVSDGTSIGTHLVKDINPSGNSYINELTDIYGTLYFSAYTEQGELWKSDGSPEGTIRLSNFDFEADEPTQLTITDNILFFVTNNGMAGEELWKYILPDAPDIDTMVDVFACGFYKLPVITGSNLSGNQAYYSMPQGGGSVYQAGDSIINDITLYAYDSNSDGIDHEQFSIHVSEVGNFTAQDNLFGEPWSVSSNWNPSGIPSFCDDVTIPNFVNMQVMEGFGDPFHAVAKSVTIRSIAASLIIIPGSSLIITDELIVDGELEVPVGAILQVQN